MLSGTAFSAKARTQTRLLSTPPSFTPTLDTLIYNCGIVSISLVAVHLSCLVLCDFYGSECRAVDPTKPRSLFHEYLIWALVGGVGRELHMLVIGTWGKNGNLGWFGSKLHRVCNNHMCAGFDGQVHPLGSLDRCVGPLSTCVDCVFRPHGALFDTTSTQYSMD
jgi:hypothetical protein